MYINIKLGCSSCRYFENKTVLMPFNSADNTCPRCGELDSLYVVSVNETAKIKDLKDINTNVMNKLLKIRQL